MILNILQDPKKVFIGWNWGGIGKRIDKILKINYYNNQYYSGSHSNPIFLVNDYYIDNRRIAVCGFVKIEPFIIFEKLSNVK